jgi:putative intracellular protease/amidase
VRYIIATCFLFAALTFAGESVKIIPNTLYKGGRILETLSLEPQPQLPATLEGLLAARGGEGEYKRETFAIGELTRILELGYGFNSAGRRTVDSSDGAYSLLLYLITRDGAYLYMPARKELGKIVDDDIKPRLAASAQHINKNAYICGANIVIAGSPTMAGVKNRREGRKYMFIEAGRIAQNIELAANSAGISVDVEPDLDNLKMRSLLKMPAGFEAVMMFSLGRLKEPIAPPAAAPQAAPPAAAPPAAAVPAAAVPVAENKAPAQKQLKVLIVSPRRGVDSFLLNSLKSAFEIGSHKASVAGESLILKDSGNREISADVLLSSVNVNDYDIYIFADSAAARMYREPKLVEDFISIAYSRGKVIGASGMSVSLLARAGILAGGKKVTGNNSAMRTVREYGGELLLGEAVVRSGRVVTAGGINLRDQNRGIGASEFASELIKAATE